MTTIFRTLLGTLALAGAVGAQTQTILFTGRFPFVSLDAVNERTGGSITQLSEFEFSTVTPGPGAFARSLLPATAMQCYLGDANNDGNYTKFAGFKTYFENIQIGGLFVRHADRSAATWDKVYFTVRDNVATKDFEVFTNNGAAVHTLVPGDWVRLLPNGNVEFFMTQAQLAVAAGAPPASGSSVHGAHSLVQTANGDLFYVPVTGGQWVNGNQGSAPFAYDGSICKIDAAAITYDANGNIASFAPNSARLVLDEVSGGPGTSPTSLRTMVLNSGAQDRNGLLVTPAGGAASTSPWAKTCGLGIDPNGGTFTAMFPNAQGAFTSEPNLVFCTDGGAYAGTIFSTAGNGSVATINGVVCGSVVPTVPATGAWLGVRFDAANFQPTFMGMTVVDGLANEPLLLDQPNFGALDASAVQPLWEVDMQGAPFSVAFLIAAFGPLVPGTFVPSFPLAAFPPVFTADSHQQVLVSVGAQTLGLAVANASGYGTWTFNNPNVGGFTGVTFTLQAAAIAGNDFRISTPVLAQLK